MSNDSAVIRILTVDDHRLIRRGIADLVATQSDMRVVAEAINGREALKEFRAHRPDITLMDIQMPEMSGLTAQDAPSRSCERPASRTDGDCRRTHCSDSGRMRFAR